MEILVNVALHETRAALVENGVLQEVHVERASRRGLVGNLYKGRVMRVLPGMQAAFIDVGLARTAFLHVDDIAVTRPDETTIGLPRVDDIRRLVNQGDEILVQVVKDPIGTKGARLTTFLSLASRFLVYMPRGEGVGVSARIDAEEERNRLRTLVQELAGAVPAGGYILRTAAGGATRDALRADMLYLVRLWDHVRAGAAEIPASALVHADLPLENRMLRDELGRHIERVLVDSEPAYARMCGFAAAFMPDTVARIELYERPRPLFDLHGIEDEIARALDRKVELKSGGHVVIDQTEAMTTIDVNTGAYVGHRNLEETIFRTNLEAAVAIVRQLRLRNLGGIIIIDFIDMNDELHRRQVLEALERGLAVDRVQTHIASLAPLGLVAMTRKRTRESLEHVLCQQCPTCHGRGFVRTPETVSLEILREITRQARQFGARELVILAHQDVIDRLLDEEAAALAELELANNRPIRLQVDALYDIDQYDVVIT